MENILVKVIFNTKQPFFDGVMRREKLEYLVTTGMIEGKRSRGKQYEQMLDGLTKWHKVGGRREAMKYRDAWKVMISDAKEHGT